MSAPRLQLDFAGSRRRGGVSGVILAVAGAICLTLVLLQLRALVSQHQGLELRRAALERQQHESAQPLLTVAGLSALSADKTLRELATPWSQLLAELESASSDNHGSVALLAIEPDHGKHRVRLTGGGAHLGACSGVCAAAPRDAGAALSDARQP